MERQDAIVIGAGLGGLAAAALLARDGFAVRVLEQATHAGGRARTREQNGYLHNLGAHALYRGGPAQQVLNTLGIEPSGRAVNGPGAYVLRDGELLPLPSHAYSLLTSKLLSPGGKFVFGRLMLGLNERKAQSVRGYNVREWLARETRDPGARDLLELFVRLTTYTHAPELLPAETAVRQLALAVEHGVMYVDGGFQSLVDAVAACAQQAGVQIELGVAVERIEHAAGAVQAVLTADGRRLPAQSVVAAIEPHALARVLPGDARAQHWAEASVPLRAACLDLGVRGLPHPERINVQALGAPLYYSNHSAYARLAPEGASTLHLVRYLAPGEDGRNTEPELRAFLERVQPGVYDRAEVKRFMPNLVVHNDVPSAQRARSSHPEIDGLQLVGDFASERALLTDAVLDSARFAAGRIAAAHSKATAGERGHAKPRAPSTSAGRAA